MKKGAVILSILMAIALVGGAVAHEGHEHKVMGTIAALDGQKVEVTSKDSQKTTVWLDEKTRYLRDKAGATASDLKVGERVVITMVEKKGKMVATEIRLGQAGKSDHGAHD